MYFIKGSVRVTGGRSCREVSNKRLDRVPYTMVLASTSESGEGTDQEDDEDYLKMVPGLLIPAAIGIAILTLVAIGGNLLTIVAYLRDRRLHTVYDFYIFNLAITDLLIGCSSMPFYAVYTLQEFSWPFGRAYCKMWLVIDFTLCLESVLLILLLSLDRLLLIAYGPHYTHKETMKKAVVKVIISWVLAFLLYGPAIIGWDYWTGESAIENLDCDVEFVNDHRYTTATALLEFVIPLFTLSVLNFLIYRKIHNRVKVVDANRTSPSVIPSPSAKPSEFTAEPQHPHDLQHNGVHSGLKENGQEMDKSKIYTIPHTVTTQPMNNTGKIRTKKNTSSRFRRDVKAARFLAILVVVFMVCWAPYTIITIVLSFCGNCVNTSVYEFMNWLLWAKSSINPFLYAMNSARYRYNFRRVLLFWRKREVLHTRESTMHTLD